MNYKLAITHHDLISFLPAIWNNGESKICTKINFTCLTMFY